MVYDWAATPLGRSTKYTSPKAAAERWRTPAIISYITYSAKGQIKPEWKSFVLLQFWIYSSHSAAQIDGVGGRGMEHGVGRAQGNFI